MSDRTPEENPTEPVLADDAPEGEAHTRRRALVILVIVVVVAVVVALVAWSVTSGAPSPAATTSTSASPSADGPAPSASASASASEEPAEGADGEVADDVRGFDESAPVGDGVTVALSDLEAVDGEASMPGEVAGPSLRFTVTFTNDSDEAYSLLGAVTNVYYGSEQIPAIELAQPGGVALPAEVAPGQAATGTFVYNVPTDDRDQVRITVDYAAAEPAVVYEGEAPR